MAFIIEGQVAMKIVIRTFLTSCIHGMLVHKTNIYEYLYMYLEYMYRWTCPKLSCDKLYPILSYKNVTQF
jgi:hypothetical protein